MTPLRRRREPAITDPWSRPAAPPELLRRLTPLPTDGPPSTTPADVIGVDPSGQPCCVDILGAAAPVLLLFLKAACDGCLDLWSSLPELRAALPPEVGFAVVTRSPEEEDAARIADLAAAGAGHGVPTVMSSAAFGRYRVAGPPFLVVVDAKRVRTEAVAWGVEETLRATRVGLEA